MLALTRMGRNGVRHPRCHAGVAAEEGFHPQRFPYAGLPGGRVLGLNCLPRFLGGVGAEE